MAVDEQLSKSMAAFAALESAPLQVARPPSPVARPEALLRPSPWSFVRMALVVLVSVVTVGLLNRADWADVARVAGIALTVAMGISSIVATAMQHRLLKQELELLGKALEARESVSVEQHRALQAELDDVRRRLVEFQKLVRP